jgi:hypothetical protein
MAPNATHLVRQGSTHLLLKNNVLEAELAFPQVRARVPHFNALLAAPLAANLRDHIPDFTPQTGFPSIKLQHNKGGGACFPLHCDSDATLDGRVLTCLVYLNPDWNTTHGGVLRLKPFSFPWVDIEPKNDRMVLFWSQDVVHRVLPASQERFCFTIWLSGQGSPFRAPINSRLPVSVRKWLEDMSSDHLKHLHKALLAEDWALSFEESHSPGAERDQVIATHWKDVGLIRRAFAQQMSEIGVPNMETLVQMFDLAEKQAL